MYRYFVTTVKIDSEVKTFKLSSHLEGEMLKKVIIEKIRDSYFGQVKSIEILSVVDMEFIPKI
jgi:hypothetical protein